MSILSVNKLALDLVARDFSNGHVPTNGGPTKTSRALAIIHLAARDAYAKVTSTFAPRLAGLPSPPPGLGTDDATGAMAVLGAGLRAAILLYPDDAAYVSTQAARLICGTDPNALFYGSQIGDRWIASRQDDGASAPQTDDWYSLEPGHHRPDPVSKLPTLGRAWGQVSPFVIGNVAIDAPLDPPPPMHSRQYGEAFDDVFVNGRNNIEQRDAKFQQHAAIGLYWGYDGSNQIGTPPRLYNQVIVAASEFKSLSHAKQVNILAAINAAMADAGIAAWYWKYAYDLWRPVVAIREAEQGFGPTGKGDQNPYREHDGDPFWLPLGAPKSNPLSLPASNFTPNFPAYPSGHATFGTACFETFAGLVGKKTDEIAVHLVSDEFNGSTTDNEGVVRPVWQQTFSLKAGIEQNAISRIYLGVHWIFDATGGETVGRAIAAKAVAAFQ